MGARRIRWGYGSAALLVACSGWALAGAGAATTTTRAADDARVVSTMTIDDVRALVTGEGYPVDHVNADGNLVFKVEGSTVTALLQSGKSAVVFHLGWTDSAATLKKVNQWNKDKLFSRAYIDDDGDPVLELELDLRDGVTMAHAKHVLNQIGPVVGTFRRDVLN